MTWTHPHIEVGQGRTLGQSSLVEHDASSAWHEVSSVHFSSESESGKFKFPRTRGKSLHIIHFGR